MAPYEVCKKGLSRSFQVVNVFPRLACSKTSGSRSSPREQNMGHIQPANRIATEETSAIIASVGLDAMRDRASSALSHGERKVLEIAIALGGKPEFLILDEPTRRHVARRNQPMHRFDKEAIERLRPHHTFCEHDMELVFAIANRIMVMVRGATVVQGACDEVRCNQSRAGCVSSAGATRMLSVQGIHTYYGLSHILYDVSLECRRARSWASRAGTGPERARP